MAKVLLVDPDPDSREAFRKALELARYEVVVAPTSSFALTMLERNRPDVIVTQGRIPDMDGLELFSIVRSDPATQGVRFVLLAGSDRKLAAAATESGVDIICTGHVPVASVVSHVGSLLHADSPVSNPPEASPPIVQGSLRVMELPEVVRAISTGDKTGRLMLSLDAGEGFVAFDSGKVVHAQFQGRTGEAAFAALLRVAQQERGGSFWFMPMEAPEAARLPRTIHGGVDSLLLKIGAEMDEDRMRGSNPQAALPPGERG